MRVIVPANLSDDISRTLATLMEPVQVFEIRAVNTRWGTLSGYFDNHASAAAAVRSLNGTVPAVCLTLNPVNPDLLPRAKNRMQRYAKHTTVSAGLKGSQFGRFRASHSVRSLAVGHTTTMAAA